MVKYDAITRDFQGNHNYVIFYNNHVKETFNEISLLNLKPSKITNDRIYYKDLQNCPGSLWSSLEKEVFFKYLGIYTINRIDSIHEKLPSKSILEIKLYYDSLKSGLEAMKSKGRIKLYEYTLSGEFHRVKLWKQSKKLVTYDEMPSAYEMSEAYVNLENIQSDYITGREKRIYSDSQRLIKNKYANLTNWKGANEFTKHEKIEENEDDGFIISTSGLLQVSHSNLFTDFESITLLDELVKLLTRKILNQIMKDCFLKESCEEVEVSNEMIYESVAKNGYFKYERFDDVTDFFKEKVEYSTDDEGEEENCKVPEVISVFDLKRERQKTTIYDLDDEKLIDRVETGHLEELEQRDKMESRIHERGLLAMLLTNANIITEKEGQDVLETWEDEREAEIQKEMERSLLEDEKLKLKATQKMKRALNKRKRDESNELVNNNGDNQSFNTSSNYVARHTFEDSDSSFDSISGSDDDGNEFKKRKKLVLRFSASAGKLKDDENNRNNVENGHTEIIENGHMNFIEKEHAKSNGHRERDKNHPETKNDHKERDKNHPETDINSKRSQFEDIEARRSDEDLSESADESESSVTDNLSKILQHYKSVL